MKNKKRSKKQISKYVDYARSSEEVIVTDHAFQRLWERAFMGASEAEYMADMAWRHGKSSGELYGRERIRMEDIKRRRDPWHTVPKLYNGVCYVFTDTRVLCTAYLWNEEDGFAPQPRRMGPFYSGGNAFCRR